MSDAKAVVEGVFFDELEAIVTGATVYQDVPEDAPFPLVVIGDMKAFSLGTKDTDPDRRVSVTIVTMVNAEERAPLLALQGQIETLGGKSFTRPGWTINIAFEDDDAVLGEDGVSYIGTSVFTVMAFAD